MGERRHTGYKASALAYKQQAAVDSLLSEGVEEALLGASPPASNPGQLAHRLQHTRAYQETLTYGLCLIFHFAHATFTKCSPLLVSVP